MKTLELTLKPEHTGKNNYHSPSSCPIACALKNAGYKHVNVGPRTWSAIKYVLIFIPIFYSGDVPKVANDIAMKVAEHKIDTPIKIKLILTK